MFLVAKYFLRSEWIDFFRKESWIIGTVYVSFISTILLYYKYLAKTGAANYKRIGSYKK